MLLFSSTLLVIAKTTIILFFLVFLKIIGRKTATLFFLGTISLFYLNPNIYIPELLLKNTIFLYFIYVFVYSILKKTIFRKENEQIKYPGKTKKEIKSYFLLFIAIFFYNNFFMLILESQKISFFLSAIFFFFIEILFYSFKKNSFAKILSKNKILLYLIIDFALIIYQFHINAVINAFLFCLVLFAFNIITESFVVWCPVNELKKGMIPAEFVIKKNNKFKKQNLAIFINSIARQKIINNYLNKKEIISPFMPLTYRDIDELKKNNIKILKIQKTINLFGFVFLAIIALYIEFFAPLYIFLPF